MEKIVAESLNEFKSVNEERKHGKPKKVDQTKNEKYKEAITGLKTELAKAKKPGSYRTLIQKKAKIKEIEEKIAKYEVKLKK
jgi:hypothetical protein